MLAGLTERQRRAVGPNFNVLVGQFRRADKRRTTEARGQRVLQVLLNSTRIFASIHRTNCEYGPVAPILWPYPE